MNPTKLKRKRRKKMSKWREHPIQNVWKRMCRFHRITDALLVVPADAVFEWITPIP